MPERTKETLADRSGLEITFRQELAADIFKSSLEGEFSGYSVPDFGPIAVIAVEAADALIAALAKREAAHV